MGKGLCTLSPLFQDGLICSRVSMASLITLLHTCLDMENSLLKDRHYLLYTIVPAIRPRFIMALDEKGAHNPISVRVGQAVDVVGHVGKPRAITGFQTHTTPVLLSHGERAEMSTDEWNTVADFLEGPIIVTRNADAKKEENL